MLSLPLSKSQGMSTLYFNSWSKEKLVLDLYSSELKSMPFSKSLVKWHLCHYSRDLMENSLYLNHQIIKIEFIYVRLNNQECNTYQTSNIIVKLLRNDWYIYIIKLLVSLWNPTFLETRKDSRLARSFVINLCLE